MKARTRPARAAYQGRDIGSALWAAAAVLLGAAAAAGAVVAAAGHRAVVAGVAGGVLLAWCGLVVIAARLAGRAHRAEAELTLARRELAATQGTVAHLHADVTAGHNVAAALRAALAEAQAGAERDRADLHGARTALAEADSTAAALREDVRTAAEERAALAALSAEVLPEVIGRLRAGAAVNTVLAGRPATAHDALLRTVAEEIGRGERQRAAALAVCATAAGRVQALATSMHAELRDMQHRHGDDVLGDLLSLDHSTAQVGRMADSIAVLTGARSGRRWTKPIGVESILRGALGRIGAYQRVRLHSASTAAVAGFAAEGVMHTLAELLDNAANFSAPPAEVHVYVEEVHSGLVITVEDGGLGLGGSWLRRAEQAVSGEPLDLTALSAGTRLGLAVVGSLARKHGLSISFRPSARGGTGVVVLIPEQLVTHPNPALAKALTVGRSPDRGNTENRQGADGRRTEPLRSEPLRAEPLRAEPLRSEPNRTLPARIEPARTEPARTEPVEPAPAAPAGTGGLPQRRRGQTLAGATTSQTIAPAPPAQPARPGAAALSAARFGAFRKALQQGPDESHDALPKDDS
ncbi:ATP-binding protein [Kitasatospora sp. NPDC049258]|uniref:ATP-binding protein n=1 Tax=Kitasatospora sp. NPDC049258 TaxID=3155394 RepID=UPI00342B0DDA